MQVLVMFSDTLLLTRQSAVAEVILLCVVLQSLDTDNSCVVKLTLFVTFGSVNYHIICNIWQCELSYRL